MDEKQKCVMHAESNAVGTVGRSIPVCEDCKSQYEVEAAKVLPYAEQVFFRQLKYHKQVIDDARAKAAASDRE